MPDQVPPQPSAPSPAPSTIRLVDPDGQERDVAPDMAASLLQDPRWRVSQSGDTMRRLSAQAREVDYGGTGGAIKAGVAGGLRAATLGGSDVVARALGGADAAIDLQGLREENPTATGIGEVLGSFAPVGPAAWAGRVARGVGEIKAGAGVATRIARGAAEGATAGGLFGAGAGVSELALSTDPLTVERVASTISSHALFGAGIGAAAGGGLRAAEAGLKRAKGEIDGYLERRSRRAQTTEEAIDNGELDHLTLPKLREARDAELAAIKTAQTPERQAFVDDIAAMRAESIEAKPWKAVQDLDLDEMRLHLDASHADVREGSSLGRRYMRADMQLDELLADRIGLADKPERAARALRAQRQALEDIRAWGQKMNAKFLDANNTDPDVVRELIRNKKIPDFSATFTPDGLEWATQREITLRSQRLANMPPELEARLGDATRYEHWIERNDQLQKTLEKLSAEPASPRLSAITAAEDAIRAPKAPSLGEAAINAVAPFAGPLGVAMSAGQRTLGSLRKVADAVAARTAKATAAFLDPAIKAAGAAPVLATRALGALSFAPAAEKATARAVNGNTLPALFRARTDEIKQQVMVADDGSFVMRPQARARMARAFAGIATADPVGADRLETIGARRIEWLASQIPRRPDSLASADARTWRPSDLEMRAWARKAAAVEDPHAAIERMAHGSFTAEDAAAIRAVYPEYANKLMMDVAAALPTLPYARRLSLSILTGKPVDPAMHPAVLSVLQGAFINDEGAGATSPAMPQPQFGSIKRSAPQPTPGQQRAQGRA